MRRHWLKSGPDPRRREPVGLHANSCRNEPRRSAVATAVGGQEARRGQGPGGPSMPLLHGDQKKAETATLGSRHRRLQVLTNRRRPATVDNLGFMRPDLPSRLSLQAAAAVGVVALVVALAGCTFGGTAVKPSPTPSVVHSPSPKPSPSPPVARSKPISNCSPFLRSTKFSTGLSTAMCRHAWSSTSRGANNDEPVCISHSAFSADSYGG